MLVFTDALSIYAPLFHGSPPVLAGIPMIVAPAIAEVSKEGDMVTLKCAAYGLPAPQFTWQPSGKEVRNAGLKRVNTHRAIT